MMSSLDQDWNKLQLENPPYELLRTGIDSNVIEKIDRCQSVLSNAVEILQDQKQCLSSEFFVLSRFLYRRKFQIRRHKIRQVLSRVESCLKRYRETDLLGLVCAMNEDFSRAKTCQQTGAFVQLPSKASFQYFLVRLVGICCLLTQTVNYCVNSASILHAGIKMGHLVPTKITFLGAVSRIWACIRSLYIDGLSWYKELIEVLSILPIGSLSTKNYKFPDDLQEWLAQRIDIDNMTRDPTRVCGLDYLKESDGVSEAGISVEEEEEENESEEMDLGQVVGIRVDDIGEPVTRAGQPTPVKKKGKKTSSKVMAEGDSEYSAYRHDVIQKTGNEISTDVACCDDCQTLLSLFMCLAPGKETMLDSSPHNRFKEKLKLFEKKIMFVKRCLLGEDDPSSGDNSLEKAKATVQKYVLKIAKLNRGSVTRKTIDLDDDDADSDIDVENSDSSLCGLFKTKKKVKLRISSCDDFETLLRIFVKLRPQNQAVWDKHPEKQHQAKLEVFENKLQRIVKFKALSVLSPDAEVENLTKAKKCALQYLTRITKLNEKVTVDSMNVEIIRTVIKDLKKGQLTWQGTCVKFKKGQRKNLSAKLKTLVKKLRKITAKKTPEREELLDQAVLFIKKFIKMHKQK